jgi:hypothetical protein
MAGNANGRAGDPAEAAILCKTDAAPDSTRYRPPQLIFLKRRGALAIAKQDAET